MAAPKGEAKGGEANPTRNSQAGRSALVGRAEELARFNDALHDLSTGSGRLCVLAGEPGVGKTRLAEEVARIAKERAANVVWGRCWEGEGAPELWPWLQVIRVCLRAVDDATLRALVGPHGSELTTLVAQSGGSAPVESPAARFRLFNAIAHFLDSYARRVPLLVILDDLHRADQASLLLLQFFTQEQRERPILLIGAYREPTGALNRALTQTLVEALREPSTERFELRGLSPPESAVLLQDMVDVEPPGEILTALHDWTGGNPFLLSECARALVARDDHGRRCIPSAGRLPISPEVGERTEQRLSPLTSIERSRLRIAAALGRTFHRAALDQAVRAHGDVGAEAEVTAALEAGERLRLLVRGQSPGEYRFAQGVLCDVLRAELPESERIQSVLDEPPVVAVPPSTPEAQSEPIVGRYVFRQEGEYWTVAYAGRMCRVKDMKGLAYVAFLLRHASQSVHVTELLHLGTAGNDAETRAGRFEEGMVTRKGLGDAGVVLDTRAKAEYRQRLADLHAELEQARVFNDSGRAERAQHEIDSITSELTGAVGLGGRDRRVASDAERARVNVARSITRVLEKLRDVHPELARHLSTTIRMGAFCTYMPDASITEPWEC